MIIVVVFLMKNVPEMQDLVVIIYDRCHRPSEIATIWERNLTYAFLNVDLI